MISAGLAWKLKPALSRNCQFLLDAHPRQIQFGRAWPSSGGDKQCAFEQACLQRVFTVWRKPEYVGGAEQTLPFFVNVAGHCVKSGWHLSAPIVSIVVWGFPS